VIRHVRGDRADRVLQGGQHLAMAAHQRPVQVVSGTHAWNMAVPAGAPPDTAPAPQPQVEAVAERTMEIWTTPHGFLKAAAANNATSQPANGGSDVSFTVGGKHRYVGRINAQNRSDCASGRCPAARDPSHRSGWRSLHDGRIVFRIAELNRSFRARTPPPFAEDGARERFSVELLAAPGW